MKKNNANHVRIMDQKIRWIFGLSVLSLVIFFLILFQQKKKQEQTRSWVEHTNRAINKIDTVDILLSETEAATRSYLATQDSGWITQAHILHRHLNHSVSDLHALTADDIIQQRNLQKLQQLCIEKENIQNNFFRGGFTRDVLAKKMSAGERGSQVTRSIKSLLGDIRTIETVLLSDRIAENESSYMNSVYTAVLGGFFAFFLVLAILFQLNKDVHLRKKAEEGVAESEEKYKNLIENTGAVMYTADLKGLITFANNRVSDLTGYSLDELSGKHFSILLDPDWIERVMLFYAAQFEKKTPAANLQFLIKTKNNQQKWVEQASQLLFDGDRVVGFQCMVKDITEQKLVEQELDQSETRRKQNEIRLNAILENTTTLIFIKDLDGRYITVNRQFKTVFGLTDEMVINKTDYDFTTKERADHYKLIDGEVIATGKSFQVEEVIETPVGRRNLLLVKFPLFDDKQQVFGISGIATDITERVQNQQQLVIALKDAEEARELQEQFLANMSHEIRTPLNGIQGMTSLLLETSLSSEQKEFANTINRSLNNLLNIVNNILDFSNIKAGKLTLQKTTVNIPVIIDEIKKQFAYQANKKGIAFIINIHETVPSLVTGDPYRLKQVLVNLVDNAVKFTGAGTIEIGVDLRHASGRELTLRFTISDTGIGIPADKQETIFKSFAQATMDISQGYGGAGLGLAISKGLVQLQGGDISVKSNPGQGAVFSFYIPYAVKDDAEAPKTTDPAEQLKGKHFLVVEDNPVNQRLVSFVLQKVGGITEIASNGREAIDLLQKKNDYDLIIMDVQMPVMGGYETAIYIRKTLHLNTPIIALTATALKEDQEKCIAVGMNDFILKPFDFNDLYRRLNRLLSQGDAPPVVDSMPVTRTIVQEKLYDLSLLEELDDKNYVADMLAFFLDNGPADMKALLLLGGEQDWGAVSKMAHKIKGAVGMIQSKRLTELMGNIEYAAKENARPETIRELLQEASNLYTEMEKQLHDVLAQLKKELSASK